MLNKYKFGILFAAMSLSSLASAQTQDIKPERIRGEIVSFKGEILTVHRTAGDTVTIDVKPNVGVSSFKPAMLSDAKLGTYVGTPAITHSNGKLIATSMIIFPEAARGTAEGHFQYDFGPKSTMTNANVVSVVTGSSGRELHLSYKGGTSTVTVPTNVPVVTPVPASKDDLMKGKKVFLVVTPTNSGVYDAQVLFVEKDGIVPAF
ncbi:MAG: hypothetical protein LKK36_02350 [Ewingella americana]|jgi:hypothetical protein|uniref:hypothetical protein n=1 Tax=Ewingella americana TaxID=41202 RepID=UPI002430D42D|nr:hypothetical protein [Ewingella americana]MCI1678266.1 hypothetical protein [Ewingella americana]MCI1856097.1 hypothetical protein [Ewingella americana]MCI1862322.1 hypothetical protein [Ewingella americana]MCI2142725.1 hypothetical protein [Ewingella americana]MCI2162516.1 hypothetical protein [Ewingella americana]